MAKFDNCEFPSCLGTLVIYKQLNNIYLLDVTSGDSSDWVYSELNCSHTYGIELGDMGRYGFLLPASHIKPTSKVILSGVLAAVEVGGIRSARSAILRRNFDAKTGSRSKIYVHPLKSTNLGQNGQVNAH